VGCDVPFNAVCARGKTGIKVGGQLEEPSEDTMSIERFFKAKPTWPPHIRAFKFQNEALPQLLSRGIDRII
jgi:hypothetical protein